MPSIWWEQSKLFYQFSMLIFIFTTFHFSPFPYAYIVVVYFANKNGCQTHKATWQVLMMLLLTLSVYKVIFQFEISIGDQYWERMNLPQKILISELSTEYVWRLAKYVHNLRASKFLNVSVVKDFVIKVQTVAATGNFYVYL